MRIRIDRDMPVPIPIQIQGQIEYGMSTGDFPSGSRLPSVRDLATELGVSPVTISSVYRALAERRLIVTERGRGTFVRERFTPPPRPADPLEREVSRLLAAADRIGIGRPELVARVHRAASLAPAALRPLRLVMIGVFPEATRAYAGAIRPHLRTGDDLHLATFDSVAHDSRTRDALTSADLVLTFAHREAELLALLGGDERLATVRLIPSAHTRAALAELDPRTRVCLASGIPEFLPTFRRSVERFAPHLADLNTVRLDAPDVSSSLQRCDVVVYGTGSEQVLAQVPGGTPAFEYRHEPDPVHLERVLLPRIADLRHARAGEAQQAAPDAERLDIDAAHPRS